MTEQRTSTETRMALGSIVKNLMNHADEPKWDDKFLDLVMDTIPEEHYEFYLRDALSRLVYVFDNERRRVSRNNFLGAPEQAERPASPAAPTSPVRLTSSISTKQKALREVYWPEFLRSTISTDTGLVLLGMATAVELDQAAVRLRDHADATVKNAEALERLKAALKDAQVEKVSDLDMAVVTKAYEGL